MRKNFLLICAITLIGQLGMANSYLLDSDKLEALNFDFVAPVVNSDSDVPAQAGLIYYDIGVGLKVINPNGAVENLSVSGANSVTSGASATERIERLRVASQCTSSPCTITDQSGSWVSSVTRSSTGHYIVNFNAGIFSAAPTCIANTTASGANGWAETFSPSTSSVTVEGWINSSGIYDVGFNLICMGPR